MPGNQVRRQALAHSHRQPVGLQSHHHRAEETVGIGPGIALEWARRLGIRNPAVLEVDALVALALSCRRIRSQGLGVGSGEATPR